MLRRLAVLFLSRFGKLVSQYEKLLLAGLSIAIVISGGFWFRQFAASRGEGPTIGGSFVEGVVAPAKDLNLIAGKLTKAGLFFIDANGELQNLLVESWQANGEYTEFRFALKKGVDEEEISETLRVNSDILGPAIVLLESEAIVIKLSSPNPSLPLLLTRPLFDYGPYKMSKSTDKTTIFTRNTREHAQPAYINKLVIHNYDSANELNEAVKRGRLDAAEAIAGVETADGYAFHSIGLNRYFAVLFNINKAPLREAKNRRALIDEIANTLSFTLTVADQEPQRSLAQDLVKRWQALGAQVGLETKAREEILTKIGPAREFQALLIGLDYGVELDPYYLWHSSQLRPPGNNLTGTNSATIDRVLENLRGQYDIKKRQELLGELHRLVDENASGVILRQETVGYIVSNNIRFVPPVLAATATDRFQAAGLWSVR